MTRVVLRFPVLGAVAAATLLFASSAQVRAAEPVPPTTADGSAAPAPPQPRDASLAEPVPAAPPETGTGPMAPASVPAPAAGVAASMSEASAEADDADLTGEASERRSGGDHDGKLGLHIGLVPSVMLDYERGHFYGFSNASLLWPLVSDAKLLTFAFGAGYTRPVSRGSRWKLDLFASTAPMVGNFDSPSDGWAVGVGAGAGMHYESAGGILFAWKFPFIGTAWGKGIGGGSGERVGMFYATHFASLPLVSLGFRM